MKTAKIKKILIAMDYAETAKKVADTGFSLAKALNAETILLHVICEQPVYYSAYAYMHEFQVDIYPDLRVSTQKFLDKVKEHLGDDGIQILLKDGVDVAETILNTAKEADADLIVIGSHSRKWLEDIIMGSEVKEVLRKTTIPIYVVPTKQ